MSYIEDFKNKVYGEVTPESRVNAAIYERATSVDSLIEKVQSAMETIEQYPNINLDGIYLEYYSSDNPTWSICKSMLKTISSHEIELIISSSFEFGECFIKAGGTCIDLESGNIVDFLESIQMFNN